MRTAPGLRRHRRGVGAWRGDGPIIAGFLTTYLSWQISSPLEVGVVLMVISLRKHLAESRPKTSSSSFDWGGVTLSALGFALRMFGVILASTFGFWTARKDMVIDGVTLFTEGGISPVPVIVGIGLLVLVLFAAWERWGASKGGASRWHTSLCGDRQVAIEVARALGDTTEGIERHPSGGAFIHYTSWVTFRLMALGRT